MKPLDMESHLQIKWAPLLILKRWNNKSWCTGSVSFVQSSTKCFSTWILLFPFHRQGNRDRQARLCSSSPLATEEQSRDQSWALCLPGFIINVSAFCISLRVPLKTTKDICLGSGSIFPRQQTETTQLAEDVEPRPSFLVGTPLTKASFFSFWDSKIKALGSVFPQKISTSIFIHFPQKLRRASLC